MKKINKITAAIAVALSVGIAAPASAEIEFHPDGRGDALLFPVYNGNVENYFTIMNNHDAFIQGHLRFRGAAWSGELRDFDIILSPGDVFVFRLADIDGDGEWEIDQSLDIKNFQYTGLGDFTCGPVNNTEIKYPQCMDLSHDLIPAAADLVKSANNPDGPFTNVVDAQAVIDHHITMGYVEFIGEAVLDGLNHEIMEILLSNSPGDWKANQTKVFSHRGTSAWAWSDAGKNFANNRGLSDVPNALTGTAFITIPGVGHGLAYNASALVNFRTATYITGDKCEGSPDYEHTGPHRIDNYKRVFTPGITFNHPRKYITTGNPPTLIPRVGFCDESEDRAVILHHEDGASPAFGPSPVGDYVYAFATLAQLPTGLGPEDRDDEARVSFNNTWGPTLADGNDYDLSTLRPTDFSVNGGDPELDDFDDLTVGVHGLDGNDFSESKPASFANSIAEVEEAIRLGISKNKGLYQPGSQIFTAYYMADDLFDKSCEGNGTRFANGEGFCPDVPLLRAQPSEVTRSMLSSYYLAFFPTKFYYGESSTHHGDLPTFIAYRNRAVIELLRLAKPVQLQVWDNFERVGFGMLNQSNCISPATSCITAGPAGRVFGHELNFLSIHDLKNFVGGDLVKTFPAGRLVIEFPDNDPTIPARYAFSWPGLMYTFEWDGALNLAHWRPMQRMHR